MSAHEISKAHCDLTFNLWNASQTWHVRVLAFDTPRDWKMQRKKLNNKVSRERKKNRKIERMEKESQTERERKQRDRERERILSSWSPKFLKLGNFGNLYEFLCISDIFFCMKKVHFAMLSAFGPTSSVSGYFHTWSTCSIPLAVSIQRIILRTVWSSMFSDIKMVSINPKLWNIYS